jgi:endoglucanase Acf2
MPTQCRVEPLVAPLLVAAALLTGIARAAEPVVNVGGGGYRTTIPAPCKPLPAEIYKSAALKGPTVTNQWWSSLVWQRYSQNMFPHPAVVRCDADGLMMAYPGARVHGNEAAIWGSADLRRGDLKIGHASVAEFPRADCAGYSDWFVTASFQQGTAALKTSFGHGSPYVFGLIAGGDPCVTFADAPRVWSGSKGDATLGVTVRGHHYGLFGASGSSWEGLDGSRFTNVAGAAVPQGDQDPPSPRHFSIAVLPDDRPETLALFARHAHAHVTDTRLEYTIEDGHAQATYRFVCTPREGSESATLFALYPHQWKYATTELTPLTYGSVRGTMKVGIGKAFATRVPLHGVLPILPPEGLADRGRMVDLLKAEASKPKPGIADTYWEGKHLGTLASLAGCAEAAGAPELRREFVDELKRRLEVWFTATPTKDRGVFYYDANWGTLIGSPPSYGSDFPLNDHHFHYGYFVRAAAEIARLEPEWARRWGPMVNLVIRDIASPDRDDAMFPYLRCFDAYAGHSWASGDANFADGNNQESSSESLNAWYGLMLWGEATGDARLRDLGIFLFNTERTAVEEYWFDVSGENYPADFPHVALGMVWGGKGAFATWFSGDIDCIHGINWLPFTPASLYMGRHPDYVRKNYERIVARRKGGTDFNTGWGDLVAMFGALDDPAPAAAHLAAHPRCKIEGGNSRPFMEHWVGTLAQLGQIDASVTSTHPYTSVFVHDGRKTHVAYNFSSQPIEVNFSDGATLDVPARALATRRQP